jgi:hypothetical protein
MATSQDVINFRRRIKEALVYAFGEKCQLCGQHFPNCVFEFHHLNPAEKSFGIGSQSTTYSKATNAAEAKKCCMLCANCHRLVEHELDDVNLICDFDEEKYYNKIDELAGRNKKVQEKKKNSIEKPTREVLKYQIRTMPFLQIGKLYGVSDNAIRKWCIKYGLPSKVSDIKTYSDEEWENI